MCQPYLSACPGLHANSQVPIVGTPDFFSSGAGADLDKHGKLGTVIAGFHYDLNVRNTHRARAYLAAVHCACLLMQPCSSLVAMILAHSMPLPACSLCSF
jgi:hypothetical protein